MVRIFSFLCCVFFLSACGPSEKTLLAAITNDDVESIKKYVENGLDVNVRISISDFKLLHFTSSQGSFKSSIYLLEKGASVESRDKKNHYTPIQWAFRSSISHQMQEKEEDTRELRIRIFSICRLMQRYAHSSPLTAAIARNDFEMVQILVEIGTNVTAEDEHGFTPLTTAAFHNNIPICRYLLNNGAGKNLRGYKGIGPIHVAAMHKDPSMIQFLLEQGTDPNQIGVRDIYSREKTPLKIAMLFENIEVIEILIESGADQEPTKENLSYYIDNIKADEETKSKMREIMEID